VASPRRIEEMIDQMKADQFQSVRRCSSVLGLCRHSWGSRRCAGRGAVRGDRERV